MTPKQILVEIQKLNDQEQQTLMSAWLDILAEKNCDVYDMFTAEQLQELDRRIQYMDEHPGEGISWEEAKKRIMSRLHEV